MSGGARPLKYLLGWLIAGTRGGVTRAKIIQTLNDTPQNANQLTNLLEMDYRTIRHHLEVLEKNSSTSRIAVPQRQILMHVAYQCLDKWTCVLSSILILAQSYKG